MSSRHFFVYTTMLLLASSTTLGCRQKRQSTQEGTPLATPSSVGYARGMWRVERSLLSKTVVSLSHILVTHSASNVTDTIHWLPSRSKATRGAGQALIRALEVREKILKEPGSFAKLAGEFSDDVITAPHGGYLGVRRAVSLPGAMVDALSEVKPGEVSRVVESDAGFHILMRHDVPKNELLSAREIIIKGGEATGGWWRPNVEHVTRTDDHARRRLEDIQRNVGTDLAAFEAAVEHESEGYDAIAGGDWGSRWLYDETGDPLAMGMIRDLAVGQVSPILEATDGFHIFQRIPNTERQRLTVSEVVVVHQESDIAPEAGRTKVQARALAEQALADWRSGRVTYDKLFETYCAHVRCAKPPTTWETGAGIPGYDQAISRLEVGAWSPSPLETPVGYHVLRREPAPAPNNDRFTDLVFEVPKPEFKSLDHYMSRMRNSEMVAATLAFRNEVGAKMRLTGPRAVQVSDILGELAEQLKDTPVEQRQKAFEAAGRKLQGVLGSADFQTFQRVQEEWMHDQELR